MCTVPLSLEQARSDDVELKLSTTARREAMSANHFALTTCHVARTGRACVWGVGCVLGVTSRQLSGAPPTNDLPNTEDVGTIGAAPQLLQQVSRPSVVHSNQRPLSRT